MTKPQEIDVYPKTKEQLPQEKFTELENFIESLGNTDGALIEILHKAQNIFGYLPRDVQLFIARKLDIPGVEVFGVVSFYSYFTTQPSGKHKINVCTGTACYVGGSIKILEKLKHKLGISSNEITKDRVFSLKDVRCIGACGLAPIVSIDDKVFKHVNEETIDEIIDDYIERCKNEDKISF